MNKDAQSPARVTVMAVFALSCFGLLLFLWLSFGGAVPLAPKGYRVQVAFPEATTLAEQADVRIAGVSVGKVVRKDLDPKGDRTLATIELQEQYAPLRGDARATLRQKTLLGETYVELTRGTAGAPAIGEGGRLADARVRDTVELDEVLQVFPKQTRAAFRRWQRNSAESIEGRGPDFNAALGSLGGFADGGEELFTTLDRRRTALRALVRETGTVFEALTRDEDALRAFIADTATWFQATASERESLAESIRIFPTFLDESKATLARLETFAVDTEPLLRDLEPALRDLSPTLRDLRSMAPHLRTFFGAVPALVRASAVGNPALDRILRALQPALEATGPFLAQVNPILQYLEVNNGKVSDFLSLGPSALGIRVATPNPRGNGHALPQLITTGSQSIITPRRTADNRGNTYLRPEALDGERYKQGYQIFPNWDCNNAGGEKYPDDTPGCFVQGPIRFKDQALQFPHVTEDMPDPDGN